jgi:cytochrome c556
MFHFKHPGLARSGVAALCLGGVLLIAGCGAQVEAPPEVAIRQDGFEALGGAFKTINDQLKTEAPDMAAIAAAAERMDGLAQELPSWFPESSGPDQGFETEALPAIWAEPEKFSAAAQQLATATAALREAAATGDATAVAAQVPQVGAACKTCHESFRAE